MRRWHNSFRIGPAIRRAIESDCFNLDKIRLFFNPAIEVAPFVPESFDEAEKQSCKGGHDDHLVSAHAVFSPVRRGILNVGMSLRKRANFQWFSNTVTLLPS